MQTVFVKLIPRSCLAMLAALLSILPGQWLSAVEVWVTLEPQAYIVEQIGGDAVNVRVLVPPGRSPATYAPTPSEVNALARSDLLFGIGVPAERRLLERMRDTLAGVRVIGSESWYITGLVEESACRVAEHEHAGHSCGSGDASMMDPHLWMDPWQMMAFAARVAEVLSELRPAAAPVFAARLEALNEQLKALDNEIRGQLAPVQGRAFFINHASLGHFAARYGLKQRSIEQIGSQPSARRVAAMLQEARSAQAGALLAQVQFPRSTADVLAQALKVPVLTVDPLRRDYPENLRQVTQVLRQALAADGFEEESLPVYLK